MTRLLSLFLSFLARLFDRRDQENVRQEERQRIQEQFDANVEKAADAAATVDPERDERLRNRFDRSRGGG